MKKYGRISQHSASRGQKFQRTKVYIVIGFILGTIVCLGVAMAVINGTPVEQGEFDAVGSVGNNSDCTGTLIQGNLVLTAAHCFEGCSHCRAKFTLYDMTLKNESNTSRDYSFYGDVVPNPDHGTERSGADLALIMLDENVSQILQIKPMPIANYVTQPGTNLMFIGFGNISTNCETLNFREKYKFNATVHLVYLNNASVSSNGATTGYYGNTTGICPGDSGGPALDDAKRIVGIIKGPLRGEYSTDGSIWYYTRISNKSYVWIQGIAKNSTISPKAVKAQVRKETGPI
jgi:V8-like Glu-specific endopeptidase